MFARKGPAHIPESSSPHRIAAPCMTDQRELTGTYDDLIEQVVTQHSNQPPIPLLEFESTVPQLGRESQDHSAEALSYEETVTAWQPLNQRSMDNGNGKKYNAL
ncbi:hypothetical protein PG990_006283 [Apiospora arundinis]|uniref:Uncharacterized protein n=1 Tax=Apiospora arundinis TaxID=335852 RepID=A0ABR2JAW1_9PEZI